MNARLARVPLVPCAYAMNRHCEERSDEATQRPQPERWPFEHGAPGLLRFARNDGSSARVMPLRPEGDKNSAPAKAASDQARRP
jgi:hypothetical protein